MMKPEMVIFDYGHTLLFEPKHSTSNGNREIYKYISKNPRNISFEEYDRTITDIFARIKAERGQVLEIHEHAFLKLALESMGIELSVSLEQAEEIIWNGISEGAVMPHVEELLDYLNLTGIRTGVISNLCFSAKALENRLNRLLPNNQFEYVLTSSEYLFRKPDRTMFDIALQKADLMADKVWYCGDSIGADVCGARNVGIFPVYYMGEVPETKNPFAKYNEGIDIDFEYLHINDWLEMIEVLKSLK